MASTTFIDQQTVIYAAWLNDTNNAVYNGVFVATTITPTNIVCNGSVSGSGFTSLVNNVFSAPGAIGSATPNTGVFTTLQATGAFSAASASFSSALPVGSGGTGLTSAGTSGYVLTSNGTAWTSAVLPAIGVGQSWADYTSSRALGGSYTNNTGKPISIQVQGNDPSSSGSLIATVGGVAIGGNSSGGSNYACAINVIVPNGVAYSVTGSVGSITLIGWWELR